MLLALHNVSLTSLLDTSISLSAAFACGGLIGLERQYRQRTAGLRTNVLVAVAASMFVDLANHLGGDRGAISVIAYVVSGVGFLGAGVIMREEGNVRGLNTAATLWGSAAVGACAGADMVVEALLGTAFVLAANTLLRPVANRINRAPASNASVEVGTLLRVVVPHGRQQQTTAALDDALQSVAIPVFRLDVRNFGPGTVLIEARLEGQGIDEPALDDAVRHVAALPGVIHAYWTQDVDA